jgi:CrcB protein
MTFGLWAAVAGVGGVGAITRFLLDAEIGSRFGRDFPYGTLLVNLTGSFVLGLLTGLGLTTDGLLIAGTATVGSYTTFSTWMLESQRLTEDGDPRATTMNLLLSIIVGVAAAALGRTIGAHL